MPRNVSRRQFLAGASLLPLAGALAPGLLARALATDAAVFLFFDEHQANVVREATARLIPGPEDDPAEAGHPGAREANVVRYIDTLLAAFDPRAGSVPKVFAGGPWSDRAGGTTNYLSQFVALSPLQEKSWRTRIAGLQAEYVEGITLLDDMAGGDFTAVPPPFQDLILASGDAGPFRDLLFTHACEGTYAIPEYGGNEGLSGWTEIRFPGDRQPTGYTDDEVSRSDGVEPVLVDEIVATVAARFDAVVRAVPGSWHGAR